MLKNILIVGCGGFLGSVLRYVTAVILPKFDGTNFPAATFAVNIIGGFVIGLIFGLSTKNTNFSEYTRLFLMAGVCGGFTTFSAFSLENFQLIQNGQIFSALIYILLSIFLCIGAVAAAYFIFK